MKEAHEAEMKEKTEKHDSDLSTQKSELEAKITKAEDDIKELGGTDEEIKEKYKGEWEKKEEELIKKHEEEIAELRQKHKEYCNDQIRGFLSLQESLNRALTEENMVLKELVTEYKSAGASTALVTTVEDE
jgi:hypothetical protein